MNKLSTEERLSAFSNYDGGYLVIGVHDPKIKRRIEPDGGVSLSIKNGVKAWLEDKLPNVVDERLDRIEVQTIEALSSDSLILPGHCIVVVHVLPSRNAPHQARDKKYYTRLGSKLSALGHRAVLDIIGRRRTPTVEVELRLSPPTNTVSWHLSVRVLNTSAVMARFVQVQVDLPPLLRHRLIVKPHGLTSTSGDGQLCFRYVFHNDSNQPLFPEGGILRWTLLLETAFELGLPEEWSADKPINNFRYRAFADEMPMIEKELDPSEVVKV